jgi:hypothetical protein
MRQRKYATTGCVSASERTSIDTEMGPIAAFRITPGPLPIELMLRHTRRSQGVYTATCGCCDGRQLSKRDIIASQKSTSHSPSPGRPVSPLWPARVTSCLYSGRLLDLLARYASLSTEMNIRDAASRRRCNALPTCSSSSSSSRQCMPRGDYHLRCTDDTGGGRQVTTHWTGQIEFRSVDVSIGRSLPAHEVVDGSVTGVVSNVPCCIMNPHNAANFVRLAKRAVTGEPLTATATSKQISVAPDAALEAHSTRNVYCFPLRWTVCCW